jgi:hypothetical protein
MGKTTLTLKMVMLGCSFLSDEIACFNLASGRLEPFPRSASIRKGSLELLGLSLDGESSSQRPFSNPPEWPVDVEKLRPASLGSACRPRFLVFLRGFGDEARLDQLASSNALFELLEYSFSPIDDPPAFLFELAGLLNGIECYSLVVGDLDETARMVMGLAGPTRGAKG